MWITGGLEEFPPKVGLHSSGRSNVLSVIMAYRVLETAHLVYGSSSESSFTIRATNSVNQTRDASVTKLVDLVKKRVSQALLIFKRSYIIRPIDSTKRGGSELGGIPATSKRKRCPDLGQGKPGYRRG
jgi:hypothetical protein